MFRVLWVIKQVREYVHQRFVRIILISRDYQIILRITNYAHMQSCFLLVFLILRELYALQRFAEQKDFGLSSQVSEFFDKIRARILFDCALSCF